MHKTIDQILSEPPDPELLALAEEAVARMTEYNAYYEALSPEEKEVEDGRRLQAQVNFIMYGPGGD